MYVRIIRLCVRIIRMCISSPIYFVMGCSTIIITIIIIIITFIIITIITINITSSSSLSVNRWRWGEGNKLSNDEGRETKMSRSRREGRQASLSVWRDGMLRSTFIPWVECVNREEEEEEEEEEERNDTWNVDKELEVWKNSRKYKDKNTYKKIIERLRLKGVREWGESGPRWESW